MHDEQVFDTSWPGGEPLNQVVPDRVPNRPTSPCPVIARLVWPDREEGWPARAIRWSSTAVLVSIQIVPDDPLGTRYVWLAADDVKRTITVWRNDESSCDSA